MKIDLKKDLSMPKLSLPKFGKPSLGKEKGINAAPSRRLGGPDIQVPKFARDLYEDLRDRHLLPLVALLIVAIVAAPIVFGGKGGDQEPTVSPTISGGETADSSFTVVPAEETLRSPSKRLGHRHPIDPFRTGASEVGSPLSPQVAKELTEAAGSQAESAPAESGSSGGATAAESAPIETAPIETPSEPVPTAPAESSPPPKTEVTETTTESSKETVIAEPQYAVTLKTGFTTAKPQEQAEVQPMTKLAGQKNPALLYIGLTQDNKRALFLLTSQVTAYYGAAHCTLDKTSCELIELKPGKSATFEIGLGEDATRYKVFLKGIKPVVAGEQSQTTTKTEKHSSSPRSRAVGGAQHFSK